MLPSKASAAHSLTAPPPHMAGMRIADAILYGCGTSRPDNWWKFRVTLSRSRLLKNRRIKYDVSDWVWLRSRL